MSLEQLPLDFSDKTTSEPFVVTEPKPAVTKVIPATDDEPYQFKAGDYVQPVWHPPLKFPAFKGEVLEIIMIKMPFNSPGCSRCEYKGPGCDHCLRYYAKPMKWKGCAPPWPYRVEQLFLLSPA